MSTDFDFDPRQNLQEVVEKRYSGTDAQDITRALFPMLNYLGLGEIDALFRVSIDMHTKSLQIKIERGKIIARDPMQYDNPEDLGEEGNVEVLPSSIRIKSRFNL